ncbi:uncharacterized protein LY79DRAFT_542672 [Colletotrichum navitas]|uniref:Uncharacterized protein n=1 Tax=Colletotrichum navitas TaxID=681940 RepID=A0AAD8Q6Y2_9PEZI|nr:uncharacterized protein LY79DRAFT_542672 [Colletotrichum navitas]KAK1596784.1 hypothetical protein LY79DRAFT_542672 [Colletotrichum navitas]
MRNSDEGTPVPMARIEKVAGTAVAKLREGARLVQTLNSLFFGFLGSRYGRLHELDWSSFLGNFDLQSQFCFT